MRVMPNFWCRPFFFDSNRQLFSFAIRNNNYFLLYLICNQMKSEDGGQQFLQPD
jgi:hypothetical protein